MLCPSLLILNASSQSVVLLLDPKQSTEASCSSGQSSQAEWKQFSSTLKIEHTEFIRRSGCSFNPISTMTERYEFADLCTLVVINMANVEVKKNGEPCKNNHHLKTLLNNISADLMQDFFLYEWSSKTRLNYKFKNNSFCLASMVSDHLCCR